MLVWRVGSRRCCGHSRSRDQLPEKGCDAFPGTGIRSGDAASSDCLLPSARSRPPAPGAAEKHPQVWRATPSLREGFPNGEGCAYRLDENALQINLAEQLPQHRPLMVFANGVAGLAVALRLLRSSWPAPGQLNTASPGQCRRSRPEAIRGSATGRGLNRAPQGLAITDQLVEIACPTWDLSNCPVPDCGAQGSHVNLPKEVAES